MKIFNQMLLCVLMLTASLPLPGSAMVMCLGTDHMAISVSSAPHAESSDCASSGNAPVHSHHDAAKACSGHNHGDVVTRDASPCVAQAPTCFCLDLHLHVPESPATNGKTSTFASPLLTVACFPWTQPEISSALTSIPSPRLRVSESLNHLQTIQLIC